MPPSEEEGGQDGVSALLLLQLLLLGRDRRRLRRSKDGDVGGGSRCRLVLFAVALGCGLVLVLSGLALALLLLGLLLLLLLFLLLHLAGVNGSSGRHGLGLLDLARRGHLLALELEALALLGKGLLAELVLVLERLELAVEAVRVVGVVGNELAALLLELTLLGQLEAGTRAEVQVEVVLHNRRAIKGRAVGAGDLGRDRVLSRAAVRVEQVPMWDALVAVLALVHDDDDDWVWSSSSSRITARGQVGSTRRGGGGGVAALLGGGGGGGRSRSRRVDVQAVTQRFAKDGCGRLLFATAGVARRRRRCRGRGHGRVG